MNYVAIDDELSPSKIELHSTAQLKLFNRNKNELHFKFTIKDSRFAAFEIEVNNKKIIAKCVE